MDYSEAWKARQKSGFSIGEMFGNIGKYYADYNASVPEHNRQLEINNQLRAGQGNPVRPSQPAGQPAMKPSRSDYSTGANPFRNSGNSSSPRPEPRRSDYTPGANPFRNKDNATSPGSSAREGNGRNVERVSPTGVVQRGTNTSPSSTPIDSNKSFDTLLAEMGLTNYYNGTAFTSNQLPTTNSNPFSANNKGETATFGATAPGVTGNTYDNYGAVGGAAAASQPLIDGNEGFRSDAPKIEGGSERVGGGSLESALSDTKGMQVDSEGMRDLRARAAFLDAPDSMSGLKRAQATRGVVYAGGQHYIKDGDGKQAISRDDARSINSGKQTAEGLLQSYKDKLTASDAQKPVETGDSGNVYQDGANNQAFKQDTPILSKSTPNVGVQVDFNNNNDDVISSFKPENVNKQRYGITLPANSNVWGG